MAKAILAEPDRSVRRQAVGILRTHQYQVTEVHRFADIARRVSAEIPQVLLIDFKMVEGLAALRKIRDQFPTLPILLLTAAKPPPMVHKALNLGAMEYLIKPFKRFQLEHRLHTLALLSSGFGSSTTVPLPAASALTADIGRRSGQRSGERRGRVDVPKPLPAVTLQELHDPASGRLDAKRIAEYLNVPLSQLAAGLDKKYPTIYKTPSAPLVQSALIPIKNSLAILVETMGDRAMVLAWLNSPHPDLGNRTPMQVILEGHADALQTILENALAGTPS